MSDVADFAARRWAEKGDPSEHDPLEALVAAQRDIASGKLKPRHLIVVAEYQDESDGGSRTAYFQAGQETVSGQMGLLLRATQMMGDVS